MYPIGENILRFRHAHGLTQSGLAARALMTPANLSAVESGRRDVTVRTLVRLAGALGVEPGDFFTVPRRRTSLGRIPLDYVAGDVVTGRRRYLPVISRLSDGLAWRCQPVLAAHRAPGARRASRTRWSRAQLEWEPALLDRLVEKVHRYAGSVLNPAR